MLQEVSKMLGAYARTLQITNAEYEIRAYALRLLTPEYFTREG